MLQYSSPDEERMSPSLELFPDKGRIFLTSESVSSLINDYATKKKLDKSKDACQVFGSFGLAGKVKEDGDADVMIAYQSARDPDKRVAIEIPSARGLRQAISSVSGDTGAASQVLIDVPCPPNSVRDVYLPLQGENSVLCYHNPASRLENLEFYRSKMTERGWQKTATHQDTLPSDKPVVWRRENRICAIDVKSDENEKGTDITIVYMVQ